MTESAIFTTAAHIEIANRTRHLLNNHGGFLSPRTAESTRAIGDAIQAILDERFQEILGKACTEYFTDFNRRAMADIAFKDARGHYYIVDVKTHREDTRFHMPNLTSIERLARFYENDSNFFALLFIAYRLEGVRPQVTNVLFAPTEHLSWDCLTIGALGWGQIQIADSHTIQIDSGLPRRVWMLGLCDRMLAFYPREIGKIEERMAYFERVRGRWQTRPE